MTKRTHKITFTKFTGTGFAEDDKEQQIMIDGEYMGEIHSIKENVGSFLSPEHRVVSYAIAPIWRGVSEAHETFRVGPDGARCAHTCAKNAVRSDFRKVCAIAAAITAAVA